jgi:hypothetical protein
MCAYSDFGLFMLTSRSALARRGGCGQPFSIDRDLHSYPLCGCAGLCANIIMSRLVSATSVAAHGRNYGSAVLTISRTLGHVGRIRPPREY